MDDREAHLLRIGRLLLDLSAAFLERAAAAAVAFDVPLPPALRGGCYLLRAADGGAVLVARLQTAKRP